MRTMRPGVARLIAALTATFSLGPTALHAQQVDPYPMTVFFGTGLINIPVAWVSPRSADVWLNSGAQYLASQANPSGSDLGTVFNNNLAIETHWGGRVSAGFSLYSQNPSWGFMGQALLLPQSESNFLPAIAVGARNIGPYSHEDRFLVGEDHRLVGGKYVRYVDPRYSQFHTAPTLYAVATRDFALSPRGETGLSLTIGGGNGLFSQDGGLGKSYAKGTLVRGMFGGARLATHPSLNTTLMFLLENDGWNDNAGIVADWRGISLGVYGTELEEGTSRKASGFYTYNYFKPGLTLGYSGNILDIARGVILRTRITELTREQERLRLEVAERNRKIRGLQVALGKAQNAELSSIQSRQKDIEKQVQEERDAVSKAEERLRELQSGQQPKPTKPPTNPPSF